MAEHFTVRPDFYFAYLRYLTAAVVANKKLLALEQIVKVATTTMVAPGGAAT